MELTRSGGTVQLIRSIRELTRKFNLDLAIFFSYENRVRVPNKRVIKGGGVPLGVGASRARASRMRQLALPLRFWGGRRRGAGRKNKSGAIAHVKRERLSRRHPLHVTLKLRSGVPTLRRADIFAAFTEAAKRARFFGLRITHYAVLANHMHFIVEADSNARLSSAFKSLNTSLARQINRLCRRKGRVFLGRFHVHALKSAKEVKHALRYVLLNERKHSRLRQIRSVYSSASAFEGWDKLAGRNWRQLFAPLVPSRSLADSHGQMKRDVLAPKRHAHANDWQASAALKKIYAHKLAAIEICSPPRTWLLRVGWLRAA